MGIFASLAGKLVGAVAGKILGGSSKSKTRVNYQQLRDDAQAAGFNPLTALRATGGAGNTTTTAPDLASRQLISDAFSQATDTWFNKQAADEASERLKVEQMQQELHRIQAQKTPPTSEQSFGYSIPHAVAQGAKKYSAPALVGNPTRPRARPKMETLQRVPVFLPDGQKRQIPQSAATRLGIEPWGYVTAGDYAELVGEIRGEGETLLATKTIGDAIGIPVFTKPKFGAKKDNLRGRNRTRKTRAERKPKPKQKRGRKN